MVTEYLQDRENSYYAIGNFAQFLFGVSGSPVLNFKGQVIGVITSGTIQFIIAQKITHLQNVIHISESPKEPQEIFQEAVNHINQLANVQADHHAQFVLGLMFRQGHGMKKDLHKAVEWFQRAAQQGHIAALFEMGMLYYNNQMRSPDYKQSRRWLQLAAEQNFPAAQTNLGSLYLTGRGMEKPDYEKAFEWLQKAVKSGDPYAQYNLGLLYYYGMGVKQNISKVKKWCQKAALQDISFASGLLKFLNKGLPVRHESSE